ncbi:MAG: T9SS type A sorting domain-containing protein [Bacteroidales bacterium]
MNLAIILTNYQQGSPCIDTGTPDTTGLNLPLNDILGHKRLWDGDGNGTLNVDMGAYEFGSITGLESHVHSSTFEVRNYPNPVSGICFIEFDLNTPTFVSLQIFRMTGELVYDLHNKNLPAGINQIAWNTDDIAEGIYFSKVRIGNEVVTKKIIKAK